MAGFVSRNESSDRLLGSRLVFNAGSPHWQGTRGRQKRTRRVLYDCKRISYWTDRRLTGLAGPDYGATISFGLPFEPEDSQYGKCRLGYEGYGTWLVPNVAWSPDGSKVMYGCGVELCAVNVHDGSLVFESLPVNPGWKSSSSRGPSEVAAAWSPDGSKIAVKLPPWKTLDGAPSLFIMDSDGTNPHVLITD